MAAGGLFASCQSSAATQVLRGWLNAAYGLTTVVGGAIGLFLSCLIYRMRKDSPDKKKENVMLLAWLLHILFGFPTLTRALAAAVLA
jgi:hypothetical protein